MQSKLPQIYDNQWVSPVHKGWVSECCSCGVRHKWDFRVVKGQVQFRARRVRKGKL